MTTIVIRKKDNSYSGFTCMGHAGYARKRLFGKEPDILCAAISALVIGTMNSLQELAGEQLTAAFNEETGFIKCDFNDSLNEKSILLMDAMVLGLKDISKAYGRKYLQVKFEEV